jgi:hypothetical protein
VACAKALSFDPWNGIALFHIGLAQIQTGRFEDALATFKQADRFDTPQVSRWTWMIGAGWANMLMGRAEDAVPWLLKSIAITSASGRTHMLLAAAYQQMGRTEEARAAMEKGRELRPGSTVGNVPTPKKNSSPIYIEAADRILPALPPRLSDSATRLLAKLNVNVRTSARVAEVLPEGVRLASGEVIPAELVVWAAGVKAPEFLRDLGGLETNRINQLVVLPTLQTTRDENIFAIGDCAACPWVGKEGALVPPRAQGAHQQASHMVKQIERRLCNEPLAPWRYRDFGSLVSLGEYSVVGNLMGGLSGGSLWIEGWFARMMYLSLYKMHELALHGFWKVTLDTAARVITRRTEPHVKLH